MAVTVMTKNSGRPLVTGLVGVSMISCRTEVGTGGTHPPPALLGTQQAAEH